MAYYKQLSADAQVKVGAGKLKGLLFSSTSSGTIAIYDSAAGSTSDPKIIDTLTPAAGSFYPMPADGIQFDDGLYVDIANTLVFTVIYE